MYTKQKSGYDVHTGTNITNSFSKKSRVAIKCKSCINTKHFLFLNFFFNKIFESRKIY